jgi:hypothetical protein
MGWSKDTLNAAGAAVDGLASAKAPSNRDAVMRLKSKLMNAKARGVTRFAVLGRRNGGRAMSEAVAARGRQERTKARDRARRRGAGFVDPEGGQNVMTVVVRQGELGVVRRNERAIEALAVITEDGEGD